ncbi:flagellar hook-associated protein FlgL [Cellulomonas oligotrophica]|uniref:flagellar hook-associated protein FlgL n=1 Tax=Cellulomonas oligotrophica TaxID=931536 RepID=UPI001C54A8E5
MAVITRVTQATVQRSTLANLQMNLSAASKLQAQMSSGKKIQVPSDDPSGAQDMLRLRADQRQNTQLQRNTADGDAWLSTVDTALTSSLSIVRATRDLVVRAGSGALNAESREALAAEVEALRDELLAQANTTYGGRSVFAGTSSAPQAFGATTPYAYQGVAGASVTRQVGPETTVRVDGDGQSVFGDTGTGTVFELFDTIAASMRAGTDLTAEQDALDVRMQGMLREVASVGARHNHVLNAKSTLQDGALTLTTQLGAIEDVDLAEIILQVQQQEVAYQGALAATSKVLQPTLLDFLR